MNTYKTSNISQAKATKTTCISSQNLNVCLEYVHNAVIILILTCWARFHFIWLRLTSQFRTIFFQNAISTDTRHPESMYVVSTNVIGELATF